MKSLSTLVFTLLVLTSGLAAQNDPARDATLFGETGLRLTGAWGGLGFGPVFFGAGTDQTHRSFGGLEFNRALFVGLERERTIGSVRFAKGENGRFKLRHQGFLLAFTPLSQKVVHPKISFAMAGGQVDVGGGKDDIFVVRAGAGAEVNLFRWCKLGMEGGYCFVSRADTGGLSNEDFSAFYLNVQVRFGASWGNDPVQTPE